MVSVRFWIGGSVFLVSLSPGLVLFRASMFAGIDWWLDWVGLSGWRFITEASVVCWNIIAFGAIADHFRVISA